MHLAIDYALGESRRIHHIEIPDGIPVTCCGNVSARRLLNRALLAMNDREAKARAVKILPKSIYRDLEAQGFDEKQIVALATELISEVTTKMSRGHEKSAQVA